MSEATRFADYMVHQGIRLEAMLEDIAERERTVVADSIPEDEVRPVGLEEKWGSGAFACGGCIDVLLL